MIGGYEIGSLIGSGSYSKVKRCTRISDGVIFAAKICSKGYLRKAKQNFRDEDGELKTRSALEKVFNEIDVLRKISHPNIAKLIDVFED